MESSNPLDGNRKSCYYYRGLPLWEQPERQPMSQSDQSESVLFPHPEADGFVCHPHDLNPWRYGMSSCLNKGEAEEVAARLIHLNRLLSPERWSLMSWQGWLEHQLIPEQLHYAGQSEHERYPFEQSYYRNQLRRWRIHGWFTLGIGFLTPRPQEPVAPEPVAELPYDIHMTMMRMDPKLSFIRVGIDYLVDHGWAVHEMRSDIDHCSIEHRIGLTPAGVARIYDKLHPQAAAA